MAADTTTLHIEQQTREAGKHTIQLTLERPGQPKLKATADVEFALTPQEHAELRWYLEDYLVRAESVTAEHVQQIERWMKQRGEELYRKVLRANDNTVNLWSSVRNHLAELRVEITTGVADAAAIPWELMYEPKSDSAIALRVRSFVRVQSDPNISFVKPPDTDELGRVRLLYVVCRPSGTADVELRAVVNQLLKEVGEDLDRFDITALRPPTYERLQQELTDAREAGRPYHIVHFDGHGVYADLEKTTLADWAALLSSVMLGADSKGKHGYLLFEHPDSRDKMRPVSGDQLGKLLHDAGVPVLVLNACQSAMHEATAGSARVSDPADETTSVVARSRVVARSPDRATHSTEGLPTNDVHDEVRAIGSLSQAVVDQGIPAVLGMRYSVYVVTAAQYIGRLYASLAKGRGFGQAATEGRKDLHANPERWVGLQPRPLQDWFVPVVYEAQRLQLFSDMRADRAEKLREESRAAASQRDPVQSNRGLLRYVPDTGFIGRDETLLMLDRAFDSHAIVLLHAYAGQGKTTTAVEFARWYATTGGLGAQPNVLLASFETTTTLRDALDTIGQAAVEDWSAINQFDEKQKAVLAVLRRLPLLWIWDNVEPVAGFPEGTESSWTAAEQRELADFLKLIKLDKATRAKMLLTSRRDEQRWLGAVPHRVQMPRMRNSDAARLALEMGAEKNLTRSEINSWQPLLDYCAGNPLTLRVIVGQAVRMGLRGEQQIEDADEAQGRDRSLGASLDYGFRSAFSRDELPIVALLHLFQGTVDVRVLQMMGKVGEHALPELVRWGSKPVDQNEPNAERPDGLGRPSYETLLNRCSETGLLTPLGGTWYTIHPALPWFLRQLFAQYYPTSRIGGILPPSVSEADAEGGGKMPPIRQSSATTALRAWVEAVGELSNHYHRQFNEGNRDVIQPLSLEESNLLHARRVSRRHGWWSPVTSAMQGLDVLYEYQGRRAEWSRLVTEIVPDYCTDDDGPIPGREDRYSIVIGYRIDLAKNHNRDLSQAANLQEKLVAWARQQVADALALPPDAPLDADQRNRIRTLGVCVFTLGQILMEQGSGDCVPAYEEAVRLYQRIGDTAAEATAHYNIGHAYKNLPDIRDLDAAETAYKRELALLNPKDASGRASTTMQIGTVHYERFKESRAGSEPEETVLGHAQAAETHYHKALALRPATAIADLGPIHNNLGVLYQDVGQTERAREHYEKAAQNFEQSDNRHNAGSVRFNMAHMYLQSASRDETPSGRETLLRRAQTYAAAALRDFQHYEGRAAADEADAQQLIDRIQQQLP